MPTTTPDASMTTSADTVTYGGDDFAQSRFGENYDTSGPTREPHSEPIMIVSTCGSTGIGCMPMGRNTSPRRHT